MFPKSYFPKPFFPGAFFPPFAAGVITGGVLVISGQVSMTTKLDGKVFLGKAVQGRVDLSTTQSVEVSL